MRKSTLTQLRKYVAGTGAILATGAVHADIVYVDVNPDHGVGMFHNTQTNEYYDVIIGGDSVFRVGNYHGYLSSSWLRNELWVEDGGAGGSVAISGGYFTDPYNSSKNGYLASGLNSGTLIGASDSFKSDAWLAVVSYWTFTANSYGGVGIVGNFENTTSRYAGVKFLLNGNTHYGWLRFNVSFSLNGFSFLDFAYQDCENVPIKAGDKNPDSADDNLTLTVNAVGNTPEDITLNMSATSNVSVSEYRLFVVKQSKLVSFSTATAKSLDSTRYFAADTASLSWSYALSGATLDSDGDAIVAGEGYAAIALLLPDGETANAMRLSQPSEAFLLPQTDATSDPLLSEAPRVYIQAGRLMVSHSKQPDKVTVYHLSGKEVANYNQHQDANYTLPPLASGMYIVKVNIEGSETTHKVYVHGAR